MKLTDLIKALADEVDNMQPHLEETLDQLMDMQVGSTEFKSLLDQYNDYACRMGEASEMVGFTGLQAVCQQVQENTTLLGTEDQDKRTQVVSFLQKWPVLTAYYLHNIDDPSAAAGLVDLFLTAPAPFNTEESLVVKRQLGDMAIQAINDVSTVDEANQRQKTATAEDVALDIPEDVDVALMEGFLQESPEMVLNLVSWARDTSSGQIVDPEDVKRAKRYVHTLKGTGATIGLQGLASLGHHFEDILEHIESNPEQLTSSIHGVILDSAYCMEQMVSYVAGEDDYPNQSVEVLQQILDLAHHIDNGLDTKDWQAAKPEVSGSTANVQQVNAVATSVTNKQNNEISVPEAPKRPDAKKSHVANNQHALRVPVDRIEDLFRVAGEISIQSSAMEAKIKIMAEKAKVLFEQNLRIQKRLFELETLVDVRALNVVNSHIKDDAQAGEDFDPLEMDQYNELYSSAHALVEEAADTRAVASHIEEQIADLTSLQSRSQALSRDLQHLVITTRMAEVGGLEPRLQRNVRTTSQSTGKVANLIMSGQDTLIDSDVLNHMAEPLLHLLRNAVDHGLETPAEREANGKAATGNIYLDFFRQGQQVILRCQDDGRGLNLEKIRNKAIERGLVTEQQELSENEIARLILLPGFSSKDSVSEISGRGVGLDVVNDWALNMNGSVGVSRGDYGGCLFELRFAASLSTVHSLIVNSSNALYALPAIQIEQAIPRGVGQFSYENEQLVYTYEEQIIPARFLSNLTGMPVDTNYPINDYDAVVIVINQQKYALAVHNFVDSRELLVKPPGRYAKYIKGVSGLSILGNGDIAVHLDLSQLIGNNQKVIMSDSHVSELDVNKKTSILIVDDALTVRNSLKQFIEDLGYEAETARDGMEAINILNTYRPDVVLTDLEMPNVNGVELTRHIRNRAEISDTPVVMITSRSQDKHRELAEQAGVTTYLTKPYQDMDLLQTIKQYT